MLQKKSFRLVLLLLLTASLLALVSIALSAESSKIEEISNEPGQWMPTGDDSACRGQSTCLEWCTLNSGPTGILCCMPRSKVGSTNFSDCTQLRF